MMSVRMFRVHVEEQPWPDLPGPQSAWAQHRHLSCLAVNSRYKIRQNEKQWNIPGGLVFVKWLCFRGVRFLYTFMPKVHWRKVQLIIAYSLKTPESGVIMRHEYKPGKSKVNAAGNRGRTHTPFTLSHFIHFDRFGKKRKSMREACQKDRRWCLSLWSDVQGVNASICSCHINNHKSLQVQLRQKAAPRYSHRQGLSIIKDYTETN